MQSSTTDTARCGSFFLGKSSFSVYVAAAEELRAAGWRSRPLEAVHHCDVILGDRFGIPYSALRCAPLPTDSFFGGVRWVNYFNGSHRLTLKASMAKLLREADATHAEWMPESYVLGGDQTKRADERVALLAAASADARAVWIIKPSNGAKGRRIVLARGPTELRRFTDGLAPGGRSIFAVQRYVERPLLLPHRRKFDIRLWALLRSPYGIYVFSQASCRTSSTPFDMGHVGDTAAHLTNHCLQEGTPAFGAYERGNEMWLPQLRDYLSAQGHPADVLERTVLPQVANIIVRSLLVMKPELEVDLAEPLRCFQLFGYDVIIEEDLHVRLLEINGSPGVAEDYLSVLVRQLLALLGCTGGVQASSAARQWSVDTEEFVLLWDVGDALPEGVLGVD